MNIKTALAALLLTPALAAAGIPHDRSIADIMQGVVTPASNALWDITALYYEDESATLDDDTWQAAEEARASLAAVADALREPGRPVKAAGAEMPEGELSPAQIAGLIEQRHDAWLAEIATYDEALGQVEQAIQARQLAALTDAGNVLYDACSSCHQTFWHPDQ